MAGWLRSPDIVCAVSVTPSDPDVIRTPVKGSLNAFKGQAKLRIRHLPVHTCCPIDAGNRVVRETTLTRRRGQHD